MRRALVVLGMLAAACAAPPRTDEPASSPPPGKIAVAAEPKPALPGQPTLADVLRLIEGTPRIQAMLEAEARQRGDVEQAGLVPNPRLRLKADRFDTENLGAGTRRQSVGIFERFETAGKRDDRTAVAAARVTEAEATTRAELFALAKTVAGLHQTAVAATIVTAARRESLAASEALLAVQAQRVKAGRLARTALPPLRARVGRLRIALADETKRERTTLNALEGALALPPGTFAGVSGEPFLETPLPSAEDARDAIVAGHPEIAEESAAARRVDAQVRHAEAGAWPDVTVGLEFQTGREDDQDETMRMLGLSLEFPLPVADRNQGAIRAALAEKRRILARTDALTARLVASYAETLEIIRVGAENLGTYRDEILPAREQDLTFARTLFEAGRTDSVDVLEARLALAETLVDLGRLEGDQATRVIEALAILGRDPSTWVR
jgi:outer membrane protein, heavy metal efflux system